MPPSAPAHAQAASAVAEAKESVAPAARHWSDVKPISDNVVDPGEDVYDEEREAAAFRAAVADWRTGGNQVAGGEAAVAKGDTEMVIKHTPTVQTVHSGGAWVNPFAPSDDFQSDLLAPEPNNGNNGGALFGGDYDEEKEAQVRRGERGESGRQASGAGRHTRSSGAE